jgi:hypothetical protein
MLATYSPSVTTTTTIYFIDDKPFRRDGSDMGIDKRLHRLARELSSCTFLTSGGRAISCPSSYTERRAYKPQEWTKLLRERVVEDFRRRAAMVPAGSSSHRNSLLESVAEDWGYQSPRSVENALSTTKTTLPSS